MSFEVLKTGSIAILTDLGRFGQHKIGLTTGGPMDKFSFTWANSILGNNPNATAIEIAMGGLAIKSHANTQICLTGANMPIYVNGKEHQRWRTLTVNKNDTIELGFASKGLRCYLSTTNGFEISPEFGSTATVVRENVGGLDGGLIKQGNVLPSQAENNRKKFELPAYYRPIIQPKISLRVVVGFQSQHFSRLEQRRFFSGEYEVSSQCDRMGYRLKGPAIKSETTQMLSEGICLGAIQIPANGQPIILMHDRQTIGGYPKIGAVLSLDLDKLAQATPGTKINFEPISAHCAHNELALHQAKMSTIRLQPLDHHDTSN